MAENEILDLHGRRWRNTRAAFATTTLSLTAVAQCVADDLNRGLFFQLAQAFRAGAPLLTVLKASQEHPAALRAAVEAFKDQQLARVVRNAIQATPTRDPVRIADCAVQMLFDSLLPKALVFADRSGCFQDPSRRAELANTISLELNARRATLVSAVELSLRGGPVRQWRRSRAAETRPRAGAEALVRNPLAVMPGADRGQKRN